MNKEAEQLALDAAKITDPAKRAEMYRKVQEIMLDDAAFIGLIQPKVQIVASAKLNDVIYNPVLPRLLLHVALRNALFQQTKSPAV